MRNAVMRGALKTFTVLGAALLLSACVRLIPGPGQPFPPPQPAAGALEAGVRPGPAIASLGLAEADGVRALTAFRASCPRLTTRIDASALTRPGDWQAACSAAAAWPMGDARRFFEAEFETARIGDGRAFVTGYYEPEIAGVRTRQPGYDVPVYALPPDLVRARPGDAQPNAKGTMPLGRYDEAGRFVPFYSRGEIEDGALAGRGLEIAWAADPVALFFVQIQGSGRLRGPDGTVMRIGYAGTNGRDYAGVGSLMRARGLVGTGPGQYPGTMQGITAYVRDHPAEGRALLREDQSYVFFRELKGAGAIGALGVPVKGRTSLAADPAFVPLGAPVFLDLDRPDASGLWVAQDTGGAIKGANRFDSFWGAGEAAGATAGVMSSHGAALVLVPKGTLARLGVR